MSDITQIKDKLMLLLQEVGIKAGAEQISIIDRGYPHKLSFTEGKMFIYTFQYNDQFLKIGKAGAKSKARLFSHHYHHDRSASNLAKSIIGDSTIPTSNLTKESIGDWIKKNIRRVDIELDSSLGIFTLNYIEAILHCLYLPKYEGFEAQRI